MECLLDEAGEDCVISRQNENAQARGWCLFLVFFELHRADGDSETF